MNIWSTISSKKFFQSLLDLLRTKDIPEVQMKLLGLIQKWGLNFEDKKSSLPNFFSVYDRLLKSNVQFPKDFESSYQIYISNSNSDYNKHNYEDRNDNSNDEDENNDDKEDGETFYYMDSLKNILKVPNFEHKYRRLVNFLVKMHENIQMANLLIDSRERSGLKDIANTLREGNNTLIDTISGGRLKDEKLMEITLGTTEDINQTLSRDEDIKNGYKPKKFTSYFVLNNVIPIKNRYNHKKRAKSTKQKKSFQRRDENYKNYDMDLKVYDKNKYKEKIGSGPKNVEDIFDLFSTSNPSNEQGHNQQQNNQSINNFFSLQTQIGGNSNNQYPELRNNPISNIFNNNNNNNRNSMNNNNTNSISFNNNNNNNNFQGNNNNFRTQFNQNNNQQRPVMTNFDILNQKLNNLNLEQSNNFNFNSQSTQFNTGFNNNMNNNRNNNNNNNNNLMSILEQLRPNPQENSNQLTPYIGDFNQNNNNSNQYNNFNNNNQFNDFNNGNRNNNQFNNFNGNNNNNNFFNNNNQNNNSNNNFNNNSNNNFNNNSNNNFSNSNQNNNFNRSINNFSFNNNIQFNNNNNQNNNFMNDNNRNMLNFDNNKMGMSQNMNNNNNFGIGQNNNQQMSLEEMEKQRKLKELDDLF